MKAVHCLLSVGLVLTGCGRFDVPPRRLAAPGLAYADPMQFSPSSPKRSLRAKVRRKRSPELEAHAADLSEKIRYTKDGRAVLPTHPAPPVIDIQSNLGTLSRSSGKTASARWLDEFGRW